MQLGLIGLGKMGGNMAERLRLGSHQVVGFDFSAEAVQKLTSSGRRHDCEIGTAAQPGRHSDRRGQLELQGFPTALQGSDGEGFSVCRCRHFGWRVGIERGLQHDDRRRQGCCRLSAAHF